MSRTTAAPIDLSLRFWLEKHLGLGCRTEIEEPTKEQRKAWGLGFEGHEYCRVLGPDGEPRDGGKHSVFSDDQGTMLLVISWTNNEGGRDRRWYVLSKADSADSAIEPGQLLIKERYTTMKKKATEKKTTKPAKNVASKAPAKAAAAKNVASKARVGHPLVFGQHAYCSVSRALGLRGTNPEDVKLGYAPWTVAEATAVFAAMNPPINPAKGSVSATLRDKRVKGAELSTEHWARLDWMRAAVQRQLAKVQPNKATDSTTSPAAATKAKAAKSPPTDKGAGRNKSVAPTPAAPTVINTPAAQMTAPSA